MDIERLKEFLVINETGSFKAAAELLGIAPNVLSARFKSFETSIGSPLLKRNNRGIEATASGELVLKNAYQLIQSWETAKSSIRNMKGLSVGSLKIQLCAQTMPAELGPFLDIYSRSHPGLFLDLYDENSCTIKDGLEASVTDIIFAPGKENDFIDFPGRIQIAKYDTLSITVPKDHRLSGLSTTTFEELSGEQFILYPNMLENHTRNLEQSLLNQSGISYRIYEAECSPYFYDLLVPIGKGIQFCIWNYKNTPNSSRLTITDSGYETYFYMLYDPESKNKNAQEFREMFMNYRKERL